MDPNQALVEKFKSLPPDQQDALLNELSPDELTKLHDALKSQSEFGGFGGGQSRGAGAGGEWDTGSTLQRVGKAAGEWIKGVAQAGPNAVHNEVVPVNEQGQPKVPTFSSMRDEIINFGRSLVGADEREAGNEAGANTKTVLNLLAMGGAERAASKARPNVPTPDTSTPSKVLAPRSEILRKGGRMVTGTGEGQTQQFVDETIAANKAAETKAAEKTAAQLETHAGKVQDIQAENEAAKQKYIQQTIKTQKDNAKLRDAAARKEALARGVETLSKNLNEGIKSLEQKVKSEADAKYDAVNSKIGDETLPIEGLAKAVTQAESKLAGSSENIKVFNDIWNRVKTESSMATARQKVMQALGYGSADFDSLPPDRQAMVDSMASSDPILQTAQEGQDAISFRDLKGYKTELGSMMSRGIPQGDVYQAVKTLHGSVVSMMESIAKANGVLPELRDANDFYRNFKETFHEPTGPSGSGSPIAQALRAEDAGRTAAPFLGQSGDRGVQMLAKYSPELANVAQTIRNATAEAKGIKPKQEKSLPIRPPAKPIPQAPAPVQPDITKIGPEELQKSKQEQILKEAKRTGQSGTWLLPFTALRAGTEFATLDIGRGMRVLADIPIFLAGREVIVRAMKNPDVMEFLSRPSRRDLEILNQLPDEYKTSAAQGLKKVIDAAQERNLAISPELSAFAATYAGSQPNRKKLLDKGSAIAQP